MSEGNIENVEETLVPWAQDEILNALEELSVRVAEKNELVASVGEIKTYYKAYLRTKASVLLEDMVMELVNVVNALLANNEQSSNYTSTEGTHVNSFMYIDPKTGKLHGNCFRGPDEQDNGIFASTRTAAKSNRITFDDLMAAFEKRVNQDASQKGKNSGVTAKIYSSCIYKELVYNNPGCDLSQEVSVEILKREIDLALERIDIDEEEENEKRGNSEYKRYRKNERAALNKLRKLLEVLFRDLESKH